MVAKSISSAKCRARIGKHRPFLNKLMRLRSDEKRKHMLRNATCEQLLILVEICTNILTSNFCLTSKQKRKLMPYAGFIRRLSRARCEKSARKIVQTGGGAFLPLILPILKKLAGPVSRGLIGVAGNVVDMIRRRNER